MAWRYAGAFVVSLVIAVAEDSELRFVSDQSGKVCSMTLGDHEARLKVNCTVGVPSGASWDQIERAAWSVNDRVTALEYAVAETQQHFEDTAGASFEHKLSLEDIGLPSQAPTASPTLVPVPPSKMATVCDRNLATDALTCDGFSVQAFKSPYARTAEKRNSWYNPANDGGPCSTPQCCDNKYFCSNQMGTHGCNGYTLYRLFDHRPLSTCGYRGFLTGWEGSCSSSTWKMWYETNGDGILGTCHDKAGPTDIVITFAEPKTNLARVDLMPSTKFAAIQTGVTFESYSGVISTSTHVSGDQMLKVNAPDGQAVSKIVITLTGSTHYVGLAEVEMYEHAVTSF